MTNFFAQNSRKVWRARTAGLWTSSNESHDQRKSISVTAERHVAFIQGQAERYTSLRAGQDEVCQPYKAIVLRTTTLAVIMTHATSLRRTRSPERNFFPFVCLFLLSRHHTIILLYSKPKHAFTYFMTLSRPRNDGPLHDH